ncbi:MAG TPA: SpoIIE family protein phosphatase [Ignavibacteriales bacterium]|nr:SpoIIE family protein phosphatase [Ignavibacteriales bacterium]
MAFNKFRGNVILRSAAISVTVFFFFYFYNRNYLVSAIFLGALFITQIFLLIYYVEKTNRDLARFINSIKFSDYSQSFADKNYGPSFKELHSAFASILEQFRQTRSQTEEHLQYLNTVVKHIKTGLISYNKEGEIELINDAAKDLLKINEAINIAQFYSVTPKLVEALHTIEPGSKLLVKAEHEGKPLHLSLFSAEFKMRGKHHKLVSLQDISSELEHERLVSELEIARDVQRKLFPKCNPEIAGYSICGECVPALQVGGDYYDFIHLDEEHLGIVIADVSGKGLPAAFYMTLAKGAFQSYAASHKSPKEVLSHLNSVIYRNIEKGSFITMFYAVLNQRSGKITYARAGHEPVIQFNKNEDKYVMLKPSGLGLGLERGDVFSKTVVEDELNLAQGDSLCFYTDGITDARNGNKSSFGMDNLVASIKRNVSEGSYSVVNGIYDDIKTFSEESPQYDDMTLIVLSKER